MRPAGTIKGKPPRNRLRGQVRAGTKRAALLAAMAANGGVAPERAEHLVGATRHQMLSAARSIWVATGVGYGMNEDGRLYARFPAGVMLKDVIKQED